MAFNINEFRSQLSFGGASPSKYTVQIQNPVNSLADIKTSFMVKAASIPPSDLGMIEVPYKGRKIKLAGDRTFQPWAVTVINDEDFLIRNALEQWSNAINSHEGNITNLGSSSPALYKSQATVTQLSKTGIALRVYTFHGLFPLEIAQIDLAYADTDTIEEFGVTFAYDWWTVTGGVTGTAGTNS